MHCKGWSGKTIGALAMLAATSGHAQLNVCNRNAEAIYVSVRMYVNEEWVTYMNRRVEGASCKEIITEVLKNRYLYIFARSPSRKWSGDGPNFCVRVENTSGIKTEKYCQVNQNEYDMEDFISIDRGAGKTSYGIAFQPGQPGYEPIVRPGEVSPPVGVAPPGVTNRGRSGRGDQSPTPPPPPPPPSRTTQSSGGGPAAGGPCSGNACEDLRIQQRDGCIVLVNRNPDRRIKVEGSNWIPAYVYRVYAGSELVPRTYDNYCHRDWYSKWMANYD
ncbi:MAG: DUF1036 domain-containing protein [Pseudomonadales bacterium]|nr:DUF1036 domain-containing protein [Pseudomonadales bacterium]MCP5333704.1 DUF1036 domain-containing protein [Pseudomonadales bacterium]PZU55226.1 MAG: hypothetical protein DI561_02495 [Thauera sp.]